MVNIFVSLVLVHNHLVLLITGWARSTWCTGCSRTHRP